MKAPNIMLVCDEVNGIHIPHLFCKYYSMGLYRFKIEASQSVMDCISSLSNAESIISEHYWDEWDEVLKGCSIRVSDTSETYYLQHDGSLFIVGESTEWDDFGPIEN